MYNVDTFICTFRIYLFGLLTEVSYLGAPFRQICVCVCVCVCFGSLVNLIFFPFWFGLKYFSSPLPWEVGASWLIFM